MSITAMKQARDDMITLRAMIGHPDNVEIAAKFIQRLDTAIAEAEKQEPVAWRIWSPDGVNEYQYTEDGDGEPLYLAAGAQPATFNEKNAALWLTKNKQEQFDVLAAGTQERKPLSEFHLTCLLRDRDFIQFARAIEAAHGIKEQP